DLVDEANAKLRERGHLGQLRCTMPFLRWHRRMVLCFATQKRRAFIMLLGGAAAAWPLPARAQRGGRRRGVGVLSTLREDDPESVARRAVFEQVLQALGWTVGRNLRIDYRWTGTDPDTIQKFAAELAALAPDVILASGNVVIAPMLQATR